MNSESGIPRDQDEIGVALRLEHVEHIFAVIAGKHGDFWRLWLGWSEGELKERTLHPLQLRKREKIHWKLAKTICNFRVRTLVIQNRCCRRAISAARIAFSKTSLTPKYVKTLVS